MPWGSGKGRWEVARPESDGARDAGLPGRFGRDPSAWCGRIVAVLVVVAVVLSAVAFGPAGVAAVGSAGTATVGVADLAGSGTPGDPYRVTSVSELQSVREDLDAHYVLAADVDASGTSAWNGGAGFDPIGGIAGPFNGTFDGDGHTITGLAIDRPATAEVGLFGRLGSGGTVTGVGLGAATVTGGFDVGGLVGLNDGGTVTDAAVTGTVNGTDAVGGLVGLNDGGTVADATVAGTVTGEGQVGGLVGSNLRGTVERASSGGDVDGRFWTGGLVGGNLGTVTEATATGTVTGVDGVGGLVGHNFGTVTEAIATGDVGGDTLVGGLVGSNVGGRVERSDATGSAAGATLVGGLVGWNAEGGTIAGSFAVGNVTGEGRTGGLVGGNDGRVTGSYWDTETTGQTTSQGGDGLATAAMTGVAARGNMTGLDIPGGWLLTDTYPAHPREGVDPFFTVNATAADSTVEEGDALLVTATVTNYGRPGTRNVGLYDTGFDGVFRDEADVRLDTGESKTVTFSWATQRGDDGTGSLTVGSGDDADSITVTVAEGITDDGNGSNSDGGNDSSGSNLSDGAGGGGVDDGDGGSSGGIDSDRGGSSDDGGGGSGGGGGGGGLSGAGPPGEVELTGATVESRTLTVGEQALVEVALANFDPASGRFTLSLTADEAVVAERTVSVAASTERTVSLTHRFEAAGTYALAVNGRSAGAIAIEERPRTPSPASTPPIAAAASGSATATPPKPVGTAAPTTTHTPAETANPAAGTPAAGPGFTLPLALLALGLVALLGRRHRR